MKSTLSLVVRSIAAIMPLTLSSGAVMGQTAAITTLTDFGRSQYDAIAPGPLVLDKAGNLYGTAQNGPYYSGILFELSKKPDGVWERKKLYTFTGRADGSLPTGPLVLDAAGNLYGTSSNGGAEGVGNVFEFSPSSDGTWTETVLYSFKYRSTDGEYPLGGVIFDRFGNLYGVTQYGGSSGFPGWGTIFELTPQADGGWKESVLYNFSAADGYPNHGLAMDQEGNLYGTTLDLGGTVNSGSEVFELSPASDGQWSFAVLHSFPDPAVAKTASNGDGYWLLSGVILDPQGNVYGTAALGGTYGDGAVFEIPAGQGANGPDKILHSFNQVGNGGDGPSGLVFDRSGNLYGTTYNGGAYTESYYHSTAGKLFKLVPNGDGSWHVVSLHDFGGQTYNGCTGIDGMFPNSLIVGAGGNLYGTTESGGYLPNSSFSMGGVVFEAVLH